MVQERPACFLCIRQWIESENQSKDCNTRCQVLLKLCNLYIMTFPTKCLLQQRSDRHDKYNKQVYKHNMNHESHLDVPTGHSSFGEMKNVRKIESRE